jgi:hypothetical protein
MNDSTFGVEFHGADGVVTTDGRTWWIHRPKEAKQLGFDGDTGYEPQHQRNWLDAIRGDAQLTADIEVGHTSTSLCHIGNISQRLGRKLAWNAAGWKFAPADKDADALLGREYRAPWTLPAV